MNPGKSRKKWDRNLPEDDIVRSKNGRRRSDQAPGIKSAISCCMSKDIGAGLRNAMAFH